jgi:hypothetical protein
MQTIADKLAETREVLTKALSGSSFAHIRESMQRVGVEATHSIDALRSTVRTPVACDRPAVLRNYLGYDFGQEDASAPQRYLLILAARSNLSAVERLPVHHAVKRLICHEFLFFCNPPSRDIDLFRIDGHPFNCFCKIALLERFPAGQYDWEVSGFPRSWVLKVPKTEVPRVMYFLARKMKGFSPCIETHMAVRPPNSTLIFERRSNKAFYRMARSVEMNTAIKGLVAFSWLFSPDTLRVTPHLSFINKPFVESGAIVTTMGTAAENSGFLVGSVERKKLYEKGEFKPTMGLVLWSREQMIRWADSHPELEEG